MCTFELLNEDSDHLNNREITTPVSSVPVATNNQKKNQNKVATNLVEVAKNITSQIKSYFDQANYDTDSAFELYVAKSLQDMSPQLRSGKRKAIVLLLEDK